MSRSRYEEDFLNWVFVFWELSSDLGKVFMQGLSYLSVVLLQGKSTKYHVKGIKSAPLKNDDD